MNRPDPQEHGGNDALFIAAVLIIGGIAAAQWLAANLAALLGRGRLLHAGFGAALDALIHMHGHWGNPRQGRGTPRPRSTCQGRWCTGSATSSSSQASSPWSS